MNKTELIATLAEKSEMSKAQIGRVLDALLETVGDQLAQGDKVSLIGFGTFEVAHRAARTAKNPRTGEALAVPAAKVPKFKAGAALKDKVA